MQPLLRVEGWRGVSHSFAMVNQHQLLAWLARGGVALQHADLPFFRAHWNTGRHDPGLTPAQRERLASLPPPDGRRPDAIYRIAFPADLSPARGDGVPQFSFMVCEYGLPRSYVAARLARPAELLRDIDRVVTPSHWARALLVRHGLPEQQVLVVPHGVDAEAFAAPDAAERAALRQAMGFGPDDVVFANVGIPSWNKGIDTLLVAFARVRARHAHARLVLKNHRTLYGLSADPVFQAVARAHPGLLTPAVMKDIFLIEDNLGQAELRALYACADAYVSPYRAEGFNLPALEALACGTPVIVTAGGPTDDFCPEGLAVRVPSLRRDTDPAVFDGGQWLEIDPDALFTALDEVAQRGPRRLQGAAWAAHVQALGWAPVAERLLGLMFPGAGHRATPQPEPALEAATP